MSWLSDLFKGGDYKTYTSPQWDQTYNQLRGLTYESLFPRYETMGKQMWQDELMPGVREAYEAKRNPYGGGLADTPEFANLSKESRNLSTAAMGQAAQDYMNVQRMLSGMVGQPGVYQETNPMQQLLMGGLSLGGNIFSNYMGANALKDVYGGLLGKTTAETYKPTDYDKWFSQNSDGNAYENIWGG